MAEEPEPETGDEANMANNEGAKVPSSEKKKPKDKAKPESVDEKVD